jgi:glycosyltransferase involved in cell wall biosynthesis
MVVDRDSHATILPRRMHVGLNLVYWEPESGGSGTYAAELIRGLHRVEPGTQITAWVAQGAPADVDRRDWGGPVDWVRLPVKSTGSPVHVPVELLGLGLDAHRRGVDVVHGLAYITPVLAPGVATVVTLLDLTWKHYPEAVTRLARAMFGIMAPLCGRTADRVIAISEHGKADLVATLGLDPRKIDVTPLGVSSRPLADPTPAPRLRAAHGIPEVAPVVLSVGQITAHKNLAALVRALRHSATPAVRLVLPGRTTPYHAELRALAEREGVADRVVLPGFVTDADLEGLYELADAVVLPSYAEGFGLPVLEAMRRGVPVACSNASSLPEVAGDAALLFDPHDPVAIAVVVDRLVGDAELRAQLAARGRARAASATWDSTAELTLACYRCATAGAPGRNR